MKQSFPSKRDLLDARERIAPFVHRTPVLTSRLINDITSANLYFKCENFQRMGAYKMRGATNAILCLTDAERSNGVVTHSSGNFAQALSLAAKSLGVKAYIVMPKNAPAVKRAAVHDYGGIIIESENSPTDRATKAEEVRLNTGATFLHPSNDLQVIIGNSTAAQELIEEVPDLDIVIAPVGGGGFIAGTSLAVHHFSQATLIGAEPSGADDAFRSLRDGVIHLSEHPNTICDGLRTNLGSVNFPIIRQFVKEILLVSDDDTLQALRLIFERMKIVVEPSAAIVLGAMLANPERFKGKKVGMMLSGGNVDVRKLGEWFK